MHIRNALIALPLAAALLLSGCEYGPSKREQGAMIGSVAGATIGSTVGGGRGQAIAVAVGALIGAIVGEALGASLDRQDELAMAEAEGRAVKAPIGEEIEWRNPQSGNSGTVRSTRESRADDGRHCREFETTIKIDGKSQRAHGIACRQPDGSWEIVSREPLG